MTRDAFLGVLREAPLVASVQASEGSPLGDPQILLKLAEASAAKGCRVFRLEGVESIRSIREALKVPVIGLIKKRYPDSDIYITPTIAEVQAILRTGCEVVAFDGTGRVRPNGETRADLIRAIHDAGCLAMADCDSLDAARGSLRDGADFVGTTLAGYTDAKSVAGPDLDLLRTLVASLEAPVFAEGRYAEPWQLQAAMRIGAAGVVVGGALNDPVKQTERFVHAIAPLQQEVGAFDLGGTWIRFGLFSPDWKLLHSEREPLPKDPNQRLAWMRERIDRHGLTRIGIGTGGVVDPTTNTVVAAKDLIRGHVGTAFDCLAESVVALNDGLATAWGHACHPTYAGKRVATLALGTGVGCGLVDRGRIWMGRGGGYPRINDLSFIDGKTFEDVLGGPTVGREPSADAQSAANAALASALEIVNAVLMPDAVVLAGSVGLADWIAAPSGTGRSPFGHDAGLYGAAALALFPSDFD